MALLVVAYDVADDRRRVRLHTLLLGHGEPVQESLFECDLDSRRARAPRRRVRRLVRPPADSVRFYPLCDGCAARVGDEAGAARPPGPAALVV
jgi:CRISPR-associated protein Cas2